MYFRLLARSYIQDVLTIVAVKVSPRSGDLEQCVLILGNSFTLWSDDNFVDVNRGGWDNAVADLDLSYFISLDVSYWLIGGFTIDNIVNLGSPVDAWQWLRCQFAKGYLGAFSQNLLRFPR